MKGAGCLFIQDTFVLVGYTPKINKWSGIGGKIQGHESLRETAIREMLEELFGLTPSQKLIDDCNNVLSTINLVIHDEYGILPISFDRYKMISLMLLQNDYASPYYKNLPMTFIDLVKERLPQDGAEITELKVINFRLHNPDTDKCLLTDCYFIEKNIEL